MRVWNAATVDQPFAANTARVCAGVMYRSPYWLGNSPCDSTLTGPARLTVGLFHDHFHAGMLDVGGLEYGFALVLLVDCVFFAHGHGCEQFAGRSIHQRDVRAGLDAVRGILAADSVIGIGQKRPFASCMSSHTLFQSACVMNPSSGVKPPMPSMIKSPRSRELTGTCGSARARSRSACSAGPSSSKGFRLPPPCGETSLDSASSLDMNVKMR